MIKRIILIVLTFFQFVLFYIPSTSYAQTPTLDPANATVEEVAQQAGNNIPGLTCGSARNPRISACCVPGAPQSIGAGVANGIPQFACLIDSSSLVPGLGTVGKVVDGTLGKIPGVNKVTDALGFGGGGGGPSIKGFCISDLFKGIVEGYIDDTKAAKQINQMSTNNPIPQCTYGLPVTAADGNCQCVEDLGAGALCNKYLASGSGEHGSCISCSSKGGVWTAAGCFYTNPSLLISQNILPWGLGIAGTVALLCIGYAAIVLQTSRGNPERIKKAREYLRACITGLLLIIFSVFIIQLIGVNILRIPGLN